MARLQANPAAEASMAFDVIQPGTYRLRVKSIEEKDSKATPGNRYWSVGFEYCDPSSLVKLSGQPATAVGGIFDNSLVVSPADKQGKVKGFVLACGSTWGDLDSEDLIGKECEAKIGLEEYQGEQKNTIKRYIFSE
jgi:hypothetical protein